MAFTPSFFRKFSLSSSTIAVNVPLCTDFELGDLVKPLTLILYIIVSLKSRPIGLSAPQSKSLKIIGLLFIL